MPPHAFPVSNRTEVNEMSMVPNDFAKSSYSPAPIQRSVIQRFDMGVGNYKYGEFVVDTQTDKFVANANVGKELANEPVTLIAVRKETISHRLAIAQSTVKNSGWVRLEGTLTATQMDWIHANGDDAWFGLVKLQKKQSL